MSLIGAIFSEGSRRVPERYFLSKLISSLAIVFSLYHLWEVGIYRIMPVEVHTFVHLSCYLFLCFLVYAYSGKKSTRVPVFDLILLFLTLVSITYFAIRLDEKLMFQATVYIPLSNVEFLFGILLFFLIFEGARRAVGLSFAIIILLFLLMMHYGHYLPGKWAFSGVSWRGIVDAVMWSGLSGIWGVPLQISASVIVIFFIFGRMMQHSGIGDLLVSMCYALAGGAKGGPAKIAAISSGLAGSFTGGPATNILVTGTFTIPMMIDVGYKPHYAGGIECAASTGASIVPPVMTGVVFVLSALTGISYVKVMVVTLIPAFLYYLSILVQVHFNAVRTGIGGVRDKKVSFWEVAAILKGDGHLLLPVIFLIVLLLLGYPPGLAACWSTFSVVLFSWLRKKTRMGPKKMLMALEEASKDAIVVVLPLSLCGLVLVVFFNTGLSGLLTHSLSELSGGSLIYLSLMGAVISLFLGMIGPIIGAYLITALLVTPPMVSQGLPPIVSHYFALFFANIGYITPPVALGAYVAAALAKTNFWKVGFTGLKLVGPSLIVPFIFVYRPDLLILGGSVRGVFVALLIGLISVLSLGVAFEGWLLKRLYLFERVLLCIGGIAVVHPNLLIDIGAITLVALVLTWHKVSVVRYSAKRVATPS